MVHIDIDPSFTVLFGWYVVQNPEQHVNEVRPKSVPTLRIPCFYSEYRERGEGYATPFNIIAKVGPSANHLNRSFLTMIALRSFFFEGDLPRTPKQKASWTMQSTERLVSRRSLECLRYCYGI